MDKTQKKKALAALAVLAILLAAYFTKSKWLPFFQKKNDTPTTGGTTANNTGNTSTNNTNSTSASTIDKAVILKRGDSGPSVKELQRLINTKLQPPLLKLVEDGEFGAKTEAALLSVFGASTASINQFNAKFPVIPSVFTAIT